MGVSRKKTTKKVSRKIIKKTTNKSQRGKISEKLILIVVAVVVLLGAGVWFFKPWNYFSAVYKNNNTPVVVTKPNMDMSRARQLSIYPDKDNVMQIVTKEKVRVTLEVPKGAVNEKTLVKLIPFYYDKKSEAPTAGVVVGPASINFAVPVTLSFNFSESEFKNQAPKTVLEKKLRMTGLSQVLQVDAKATSLTPTLIARGIETQEYLPARILTGGAYVFSLDGKHQLQNARKALDTPNMHTLTVMESATILLFNNQQLSSDELKKTQAAVAKILSKKNPPAFEFYAALVLQKKIKNPLFTLIPKAYAYEVGEGYFQTVCRQDNYTVEEYIGLAKAAQLMGNDDIGQSCLNKAKNKVAEDTKKVLAGDPDLKTVIVQLKDVQLLGLDTETNLDEQLQQKAKEVATKDAQKVANDPNATAIDAAKAMQRMEAVGADNGSTYDKLSNTVKNSTEKYDAPKEDPYAVEPTIDDEEILYNQAMSVVGVEMLKAFGGLEGFDKDSLKKKFDTMQEETKGMVDDFYSWCLEMRAEGNDPGNCEQYKSEADSSLKQADDTSYRLEEEVGQAQSQAYEEPDYLQNNGDVQLYFEDTPTPTPDGGSQVEDSPTPDNSSSGDTVDQPTDAPTDQPSDINSQQDNSSSNTQNNTDNSSGMNSDNSGGQ